MMALTPPFVILVGGLYSFLKRRRAGRDTDLRSMLSPNEKWCSAVDDANKNRAGIANVSYVNPDSNTTCGMPYRDAWQILRDPVESDMPWPGFLLGQTPSSIW